jgi:hypothetical protein
MKISYFLKGVAYLGFAGISPLLLERHLAMAVVQTSMLGVLGCALIYKGLRTHNPGARHE